MRAILMYEDTGNKGVCGQTAGANGAGIYCIIYAGDEEKIHDAARELIRRLESAGRLGFAHIVYGEELFTGIAITEITV